MGMIIRENNPPEYLPGLMFGYWALAPHENPAEKASILD
jgi:hypothetical protein